MTYYYLYQITNNINGKIYIGQHTTEDLADGYMGSGKLLHKAYKKYGKENFTKEILSFYGNPEELDAAERLVVNEEFIDREDTYNLVLGGPNPVMFGEQNPMFGKHPEVWNKGKKCPQISESLTGHKGSQKVVEHFRQLGKDAAKRPQNQKGYKHGEENREKHRQACLGRKWWTNGKDETFQRECPEGYTRGRLK